MKSKWLILAFIFSVTVNLAAAVTLGYYWWQREQSKKLRPGHEVLRNFELKKLNLSEDQISKLKQFRENLQERIRGHQIELKSKRARLIELLRQPEPDQAAIDTTITQIALLQGKIEKEVIHNLIQHKEILTPEQFDNFLMFLEHRFFLPKKHERLGRPREKFPPDCKPMP